MPVKIHNKMYKTVAERVQEFHAKFKGNSRIETQIISNLSGPDFVTMKAYVCPDVSKPECYYTGIGREVFTQTGINSTSAYENCETSAIGRALAAAGFGGEEFASADEVAAAIKGGASIENKKPATKKAEPAGNVVRSAEDNKKMGNIKDWLLEMTSKDVAKATQILLDQSAFIGKDKKKVAGVNKISDLKGGRLTVTHDKIKQAYDSWKEIPKDDPELASIQEDSDRMVQDVDDSMVANPED